ncbi:23S rRNA (uracil(1939)-C(5))-methyltransferase RlmD [soil metagenome]
MDALAYGGEAIARHEGYVLFTKYAAPGDRARVRVTKSKSSFGEAQLLEVIEPAPTRVDPPCPIFTICGGCSWQHLAIEEQRKWKERIVADALRPLPNFESIPVRALVASPDTWRYRNKMEFTFSRGGGPLVGGFHKPGNWREILDVKDCWLAPESLIRVLRAAVTEGERQGAAAWNPSMHEGTLRQLVLRHSVEENSILAMLLTGDRNIDFDAIAKAMFAAEPTLKGIAWGLNPDRSDVARAHEILETRGAESFEEALGHLRFRISLASFFQTNTRGAAKLYEVTKNALELTGRERLLDAYCGTGTIGIFCADQCREIYGVEIIQEAVWDARENAARNGIQNATFMAGDMRLTLPRLLDSVEGRIDRLVVDPPRSGMDKRALAQLLAIRAPRMAYVSCNPSTMARDLQTAIDAGYRIEEVTPVDMFPHTYHVECVAKMALNP